MYPQSLSPVQQVDLAFYVIFGVSAVMLLGITATMLWFVWRYDHRRNPVATEIPGSVLAETAWTLIPTLIVMALFYYGWAGYKALRTVPADALEVGVKARMWSWIFEYPNGKRSSVLYVPAGKPVKLDMTSVDVIHSLYIPAFRIKMDTVPGMQTYAWFKTDGPGEFDILCAEYCGLKHANMLSVVKAVEPDEFRKWLESSEAPGGKGRALLDAYGCISCHSLDGSPGPGTTFKGLYGAERVVVLGDGSKRKVIVDEAYLRRALKDPNAELVEGFEPIMPSTEGVVPEQDFEDMIAWFMHGNGLTREEGRRLMEQEGCLSCHSTDGSVVAGPTFKNLWGSEVDVLVDGVPKRVKVDADYVRESIVAPQKKLSKGWDPLMPGYDSFTPEQMEAMMDYMRSLSGTPEKAPADASSPGLHGGTSPAGKTQ